MKTRYRVGKEGVFGKPVLILQVFKSYKDGPSDSYGMPEYLAGSGWFDATVEDITESLAMLREVAK